MTFFMKKEFPLLAPFENSWINFLGLAFAYLHSRNIGTLADKAYDNAPPSPALSNSFIKLLDMTIDRGLYFAKWAAIILMTSASYTVIITYLLTLTPSSESLDMPTRRALGVILYLALAALGTFVTYRHHKAKR